MRDLWLLKFNLGGCPRLFIIDSDPPMAELKYPLKYVTGNKLVPIVRMAQITEATTRGIL